ncbi:DUF11 domain-containing protein [Bacillus pakistanensis]|uniref:DUF11 domain-containing protein n=1 Tax=Rossellomorea pakistanensis TaxID=992288 RepID=UPI001965D83B
MIATNNGPSPATGVIIEDLLPPEVTFVSTSPNCTFNPATNTVTCETGNLDLERVQRSPLPSHRTVRGSSPIWPTFLEMHYGHRKYSGYTATDQFDRQGIF